MIDATLKLLLTGALCGATYHALRYGRVPGHLIALSILIILGLTLR